LLRKKILKKRCIYDFTMRLTHQYYRDHYHKMLEIFKYDEEWMPTLGLIDNAYE